MAAVGSSQWPPPRPLRPPLGFALRAVFPSAAAQTQSLAGHRFHAAFAAVMRCAFRLLPPHVVEAAAGAVSAWAHGTADASTMPAAASLGGSLAWGITS